MDNKIICSEKAPNSNKNTVPAREKMILVAMLTGSDYTEGIDNVGPVTGLVSKKNIPVLVVYPAFPKLFRKVKN